MKPEINSCTHLKYWARHQRKILSISRLFINNIRDVGSTANFADSADSADTKVTHCCTMFLCHWIVKILSTQVPNEQ